MKVQFFNKILRVCKFPTRLRALHPSDDRWKGVLHGVRDGGDPPWVGDVPEYRRAIEQVRVGRHQAGQDVSQVPEDRGHGDESHAGDRSALEHNHHYGRGGVFEIRGLELLRQFLLLFRHAHDHRLRRLRRSSGEARPDRSSLIPFVASSTSRGGLNVNELSLAERPRALQQARIRGPELGLHPVRSGSGRRQYQSARTALHDDVSTAAGSETFPRNRTDNLTFVCRETVDSSRNRNTGEARREDTEMQSASHHVLTLDGEVMAVNGKLLAGHVPIVHDTDDCVSVCSCTCLGPANSELLDPSGYQGYRPPSTSASLRVKRASV